MGLGLTTPGPAGPVGPAWVETEGDTGDELDEDDVGLVFCPIEVKNWPNGLGRPGQRAGGTRPYRACCCWWAAIKACNC
jgi:hypothetical protein